MNNNNTFTTDTTDIATVLCEGYPFEELNDIQRFILECDVSWLLKAVKEKK